MQLDTSGGKGCKPAATSITLRPLLLLVTRGVVFWGPPLAGRPSRPQGASSLEELRMMQTNPWSALTVTSHSQMASHVA